MTPSGSLMPVGDAAAAGVVRADLDGHAVAREDADVELPHPAADRGEHDQPVVTLHTEHRVRQRLLDDAVEFELVAFRLLPLATFTHSNSFILGKTALSKEALR